MLMGHVIVQQALIRPALGGHYILSNIVWFAQNYGENILHSIDQCLFENNQTYNLISLNTRDYPLYFD